MDSRRFQRQKTEEENMIETEKMTEEQKKSEELLRMTSLATYALKELCVEKMLFTEAEFERAIQAVSEEFHGVRNG